MESSFDDNLNKFVEKFGGQKLNQTDSLVGLLFEGQETELLIKFSMIDYWHYDIYIENTETITKPCLHLRIYINSDSQIEAKIIFIRTQDGVKCKIPKTKAGLWLVNLVNFIACQLGIKKVLLEDDAVVYCQTQPTRFLMLRIYKGQRSWYEEFGYQVNFQTNRIRQNYGLYNKEMYDYDITFLISMPITFVINVLENLDTLPLPPK